MKVPKKAVSKTAVNKGQIKGQAKPSKRIEIQRQEEKPKQDIFLDEDLPPLTYMFSPTAMFEWVSKKGIVKSEEKAHVRNDREKKELLVAKHLQVKNPELAKMMRIAGTEERENYKVKGKVYVPTEEYKRHKTELATFDATTRTKAEREIGVVVSVKNWKALERTSGASGDKIDRYEAVIHHIENIEKHKEKTRKPAPAQEQTRQKKTGRKR
jgi:hypothetical protein